MTLFLISVQNALKNPSHFRKMPSARSPKVSVNRIIFILRNILKNEPVILATKEAVWWCSRNRYLCINNDYSELKIVPVDFCLQFTGIISLH